MQLLFRILRLFDGNNSSLLQGSTQAFFLGGPVGPLRSLIIIF